MSFGEVMCMALRVDAATIEKIRKVLAKAANNPSVEEAQTAAGIAQRLLLRHGLTVGEVVDDGDQNKEKEKVVTEVAPDRGEHR